MLLRTVVPFDLKNPVTLSMKLALSGFVCGLSGAAGSGVLLLASAATATVVSRPTESAATLVLSALTKPPDPVSPESSPDRPVALSADVLSPMKAEVLADIDASATTTPKPLA